MFQPPRERQPRRKWSLRAIVPILAASVTFSVCLSTALRGEEQKAREDEDKKQEELERASHNPYLWAHFSEISGNASVYTDRFGERLTAMAPRSIREHETELRIESFLKKVRNQAEQLVSCGQALLEWDQDSSSREDLDQLLRRTEGAAKDLRTTLVFVYYPIAESDSRLEELAATVTVEQLGQSIFDTYRRVYGSVFGKDATVSVDQLRHGDMLASLSDIQRTARELRR